MKRIILFSALLIISLCDAFGQGVDVSLENRDSWHWQNAGNNGYTVDYLQLTASGSINEHFSFSVRQHLNRPIRVSVAMDATDWAWVKYNIGAWTFCGGKMMLEYGGFEYDEAPINLYYCGEYWNNFNGAFTFASYVSRKVSDGALYFQISASPFQNALSDGLYGYSLSYRGSRGIYSWKHSINFFEAAHLEFLGHCVLGNRLDLKPFALEFDLYHRMDMSSPSFFDDFSVIAKVQASLSDRLDVFAKADYDFNSSVRDPLVAPGSELFALSAGLEYYPLEGNRDIRLHCVSYHRDIDVLMAGITWRFHLNTK